MKKKILIVGNSAKEYALAKKLSEKHDVYITPSGDALKEFATCLDIRGDNINELLEFVLENGIDLTIAISERALKADIATKFNNNKQPIFAPTAGAFEIISKKTLAKKTLYKLHIPTPKFGIFEKINLANDYIKNQELPFVIKTNDSGSATVITSANTAKNILDSIFAEKNKKAIIEDYVYGSPFSFYTLTDGYKAIPIGSSITYKYSLEGDGGQLTKGMGACSPNYKLSIEQEYYLLDNTIYPTLSYLENSGNPYLGVLGINGIISADGSIKVLGWQSFMQDCDTSAILSGIDDDLYNLFDSCVIGSFSDEIEDIKLNNSQSVSLVLTCKNKENKENIINGIDLIDDNIAIDFYPATRKNKYLEYEAETGEVLVLTSTASSLSKASKTIYSEVSDIDYLGKYYRKDICKLSI